ncbi:MAG: RecQ family ATP-dependent DNA helicase [Spirochaetales bacterium]
MREHAQTVVGDADTTVRESRNSTVPKSRVATVRESRDPSADGSERAADADPIVEEARTRFGTSYLFPYQRLVIGNILEAAEALGERATREKIGVSGESGGSVGKNIDIESEYIADIRAQQTAVLPTGSGKSLCFQLPASLLRGPTLVVYPLISLVADQKRRIEEAGIRCEVLRGGQTSRERVGIARKLRRGEVKMLLTSPEALCGRSGRAIASECGFSHAVIDEAHCVSEWGLTFRGAYLELGQIIRDAGIPLVTAFTATATEAILDDIDRYLFPGFESHRIEAFPDRPELRFHVVPAISVRRTLTGLLRGGKPDPDPDPFSVWRPPLPLARPAIIFCRTRGETEQTARMIARKLPETDVGFYHAGLEKPERSAIEEWFFNSQDGVLVATTAYGMGVDKKNVRSVVHTSPAGTFCSYVQESGRAGRDRQPADAVMLFPAFASDPHGELVAYARSDRCRRESILAAFGRRCEACTACDICCGTHRRLGEEDFALLASAESIARRTSRSTALRQLAGSIREAGLTACIPGYGRFRTWQTDEIREIVEIVNRKLSR